MALALEIQIELRRYYDNKINKRRASIELGITEQTASRYYTKWEALDTMSKDEYHVHLTDMFTKELIDEMAIQAKMRRMTIQGYVSAVLATVVKDNLSAGVLDMIDMHPVKKRLANVG